MSKKSVVSLTKKPNSTLKASLLQPYFRTWNQLSKENSSTILQLLEKLFEAHPEWQYLKSSGKKKQKAARQTSSIRSSIVVGLQEVTKALENDRVLFFLVCNSCQPQHFNHHLLLLSGLRGVPTASVPDLSLHIAPLLNIRSVTALAVLKDSPLLDVTETASLIIPYLKVSPLQWMNNSSSKQSPKSTYVPTKICVNRGGIKKRA